MTIKTRFEDPNDWKRLFDLIAGAHLSVNCDSAVWIEEAVRCDASLLGWPRPRPMLGDGWERMQTFAFVFFVEMSIAEWAKEDPQGAPPYDINSSLFQTVLRVAQRALEQFVRAAHAEFGGIGRLSGKRAAMNEIKAVLVEKALRSGMPRSEAYAAVGMTKQSVSRAQKRARERLR